MKTYKGYTTSMEQVEVEIEAANPEEAVAKLRAGDFVAELIVETRPAALDSYFNKTYGVDTLYDEDDNEINVGSFAEVA